MFNSVRSLLSLLLAAVCSFGLLLLSPNSANATTGDVPPCGMVGPPDCTYDFVAYPGDIWRVEIHRYLVSRYTGTYYRTGPTHREIWALRRDPPNYMPITLYHGASGGNGDSYFIGDTMGQGDYWLMYVILYDFVAPVGFYYGSAGMRLSALPSSVPLPGTFSLMVAGIAGLGAIFRRRRQKGMFR